MNRKERLNNKQPEDLGFFLQETILIDWFYLQKHFDRSNYTYEEKKDLTDLLQQYESHPDHFDSDDIRKKLFHLKQSELDPIESGMRYTQTDILNRLKQL